MSVEHIILTRFNLGAYDRPDADEWMARRLELFEDYTLPSMLRQTCRDWRWVLAFDERTPAEVLCRYDYIDNIELIYEQPSEWIRRQHVSGIRITTRLDNDDYVERGWIEDIRTASLSLVAELVGLPFVIDTKGRALDVATGKYYDPRRPKPNSMFLSVVSARAEHHCFTHQHTFMPDHYPAYTLNNYGWVMVCHEQNLMNHIKQSFRPDVPQTYYIDE